MQILKTQVKYMFNYLSMLQEYNSTLFCSQICYRLVSVKRVSF